MEELKQKLLKMLEKVEINHVGFTDLYYSGDYLLRLKKQSELDFRTPFQVVDNEKLDSLRDKYKSAIVVLLPYQNPNDYESELGDNAYLSSFAWGEDYHLVLKSKLDGIREYLCGLGYPSEVFVDNNVLDERYLASKCGLGYFGKNNLLINDELGTYFFIGIVLTEAKFYCDSFINKKCLECNACIDVCPVGAINSEGVLNGKVCLSYIRSLKDSELEYHDNCIYGCDICSKVCPHNIGIKKNNNFLPMERDIIDTSLDLNFSNREFKIKYYDSACGWRGKKVFLRNFNLVKERVEKK